MVQIRLREWIERRMDTKQIEFENHRLISALGGAWFNDEYRVYFTPMVCTHDLPRSHMHTHVYIL